MEAALQYEKTYAESIVETVQDPLIVLDGQLRITSANSAFYRMFQVKPEEVVGRVIYDLGNQQWDIAAAAGTARGDHPEGGRVPGLPGGA